MDLPFSLEKRFNGDTLLLGPVVVSIGAEWATHSFLGGITYSNSKLARGSLLSLPA